MGISFFWLNKALKASFQKGVLLGEKTSLSFQMGLEKGKEGGKEFWVFTGLKIIDVVGNFSYF